MPIYAAGPRPATMTLAPTSRRCIKHTLDRYLPLRSSTTKQRNSADPTPQIIARIASRPVSPDSSRAQISIAPARHRPTFPDRGFLPWRLSDAGRRCTWHRRVRPASETLHRSRHSHNAAREKKDRLAAVSAKRAIECLDLAADRAQAFSTSMRRNDSTSSTDHLSRLDRCDGIKSMANEASSSSS